MTGSTPERRRDPLPMILGISAGITGFLVWWIYFKTTGTTDAAWVTILPAANATFNTLAAVCLLAGYRAIKRREIARHKRAMLSAVGFSALFLSSYLLYHHFHGDTPFGGDGMVRPIYFAILISHILLSVIMLPMILSTLFYAGKERFSSHKKIARWTLPVWLYVSITGVAIFFLLKIYG